MEKTILDLYINQNLQIAVIARKLKITTEDVYKILNENGYLASKGRKKDWVLKVKKASEYYKNNQKMSIRKTAEMFDISEDSFSRALKEYGIDTDRKLNSYSFDEHVFDSIDTEEKAYWLGFIFADGYISSSPLKEQNKKYIFEICLALIDTGHLFKFYSFIKTEKPNIFIGIKKGKEYICSEYEYKIKKDMKSYLYFKENHTNVTEEDFISYEIETKDNYEIGDKIFYKELKLVVIKKELKLKGSDLLNKYELKQEKNIKQEKLYNNQIVGQVINGKVIKIEKDKMKVHLEIDENQEESKAYLYNFGSNYTTEGNTGWYIMPELNNKVELYIPTKSEGSAYLRKVLREDGKENEKTQDTSMKYFGTKDGKELKMAPDELRITTNGESLYINMQNTGGVSIISNENINIYSEKNIKIESQKLQICSNDKIAITTKESNIVIDNVIHLYDD